MSALGFSLYQRQRSRKRAVTAAMTFYNKARNSAIYSQGPDRWSGINQHKRAYKGEYPPRSDCSSSTTWMLWDATLRYEPRDFVNNQKWKAGYTGTMQSQGARVSGRMLPGDCVFYGNQGGGIAQHVAIYIGNGTVISHGGPGVRKLPWNYRSVNEIRRYIR